MRRRAIAAAVGAAALVAGAVAIGLLAEHDSDRAGARYDGLHARTAGAHAWLWSPADADVTALRRLSGVRRAAGPLPYVLTSLSGRRGGAKVRIHGGLPRLSRPLLVAGGWPRDVREIVLESSLAEAIGTSVGEVLDVEHVTGTAPLTVTGLVELSQRGTRPPALPGAAFAQPGSLDLVDPTRAHRYAWSGIALTDPPSAPAVAAAAAAALPPRVAADSIVEEWTQVRSRAATVARADVLVPGSMALLALALLGVTVIGGGVVAPPTRGRRGTMGAGAERSWSRRAQAR